MRIVLFSVFSLWMVAGCSPVMPGPMPSAEMDCTTHAGCPEGYVCQGPPEVAGRCVPQGEADIPGHGGKEDTDWTEPDPGEPEADPAPKDGLPCEIDTIMATHCRHCHSAMPTFGAPMPLVTLEDMRAHGQSSLERAIDEQRPMPPPPLAMLGDSEIDALAQWVTAGMPAGPTCDVPPPVRDPSELMPEEPEEECGHVIELRAHEDDDGVDKPFPVPPETDLYVCFTFRVPWPGQAHGLSFRPIVDDARVLHHWLLYTGGEEQNIGQARRCNGQHRGAALVAGWAPGGNAWVMPPNVGMEVPDGPDGLFTLEIHYHNEAGYADALD